MRTIVVGFLLSALQAAHAFGAGATTITGRVVDENEAPVPEAVITVPQPHAVATSDSTGAFRLEIPSPGPYEIRAERDGFFVFTQTDAVLKPDSPLEIHLNHLKELAESVDVHYSPPTIDPEQTSDTRRLNSQEILNVPYPASQDYRNALQLMPGALLDNAGQLHFNGGDTRETNYRLNGFDISDPATGGLNARLNVDAVRTLEWDASRFSAREGRGSAGTVDVRTEMGDDRWRFAGTNFVPGFGSQDGLHLDHWSPRVRVSGPIRKSRAWFSNALDSFYSVSTVSGLPSSANRTRSLTASDLTRLQWNITPAQILTASFLVNLSSDTRYGLSFLTPAETTLNRRTSLFVGSLKDQWSVAGGLFEVGFASTAGYLRSAPQGTEAYVVTPFGSRGNYFADQTSWTERQEWTANESVRPLRRFGTHQIEIGADVERGGLDRAINRHEFTAVRVDNSIIRDVQFLGSPRQFRHDLSAYGYALDRWTPNDTLVIEAGFRSQWNEYTGMDPAAPRIATSWSPKLTSGAKFSAGWGIFYDAITLNMIALSQEQTGITTFYGPAGDVSGVPIETRFVLRPQMLRLPRFAVTSFSAEKNLPWGLFGKLNVVSREGSRGFAFVENTVSPALNLYVLDNIQRQHYRAAEFAVRRTFLAKYEWFASYTRSASHANAVVTYSVENPLVAPHAVRPSPWDAPNRFLMWGWAPVEKAWFPHWLRGIVGETDAQVLADFRSGYPFSAVTETNFLAGAPNSYRLPFYGTLNVALERRFPFRGYLWAFRVSLINALNRANPNVVNNDINSPAFLTYQPGQARAVTVRLRFLGRK